MKKIFFAIAAAAALVCSASLISCHPSPASVVADYETLCNDIAKAVEKGDISKLGSFDKRNSDLLNEYEPREGEYSAEEKAKINELREQIDEGMFYLDDLRNCMAWIEEIKTGNFESLEMLVNKLDECTDGLEKNGVTLEELMALLGNAMDDTADAAVDAINADIDRMLQ